MPPRHNATSRLTYSPTDANQGMGIVHVLTGPDHLSALATLSANVGNYRAFWYGVRWGIGHSIGLILVGSTFIILSSQSQASGGQNDDDGDQDGDDDTVEIPERIESIAETFVGLFMLALGSYSLVKAYRTRRNAKGNGNGHVNRTDNHDDAPTTAYTLDLNQATNSSSASVSRSMANAPPDSYSARPRMSIMGSSIGEQQQQQQQNGDGDGGYHGHSHLLTNDANDAGVSKKLLTVCIGIVHGVAGPGGVLGVIPAVQLHNVWLSTVYLGSFCVTSTLVMGGFAAAYGICSSRISGDSETFAFRMEVFSASLSIVVGCLWLSLLYLGILHDIFP